MTVEQLLIEIRHVVEGGTAESPAVRKKLAAIANRAGAAELLVSVLRDGEPFVAQVAALALPHAENELVRRALQQGARRTTGERRLCYLGALTPGELQKVLAETGGMGADELVEAAGLLAMNSPGDFVEVLCEGTPVVELAIVEHVERVRRTFAIRAAALYGPLLERRLSSEARQRTIAILGRESGTEVRGLLEREQARLIDDADRKTLRREQLRQATITAAGPVAESREGLALLSPLDVAGEIGLEIFERVDGGRVLHSTVRIGADGAEHVTAPSEFNLETNVTRIATHARGARLTLGQARTFLESLPAVRRAAIAPLVDRLGDVAGEPLPGPQPSHPLAPGEARALVAEPLWRAWRPFQPWIAWPEEALRATAQRPPEVFPGGFSEMVVLAGMDVALAYGRRRVPLLVSAGLRHMALVMHLMGDGRASAVAAEAVAAGRKRSSSLALALAERERWTQLWTDAALPPAYRAGIRERLRDALGTQTPGWADVRVLDFAQAAAEGLAREAGEQGGAPGLLPVGQLAIDRALRLAERAVAALADRDLLQRVRAGQNEILAETARGWVESVHPSEIFQLVRFVGSVCFGTCPHRCLDKKPRTGAAEVFAADTPPEAAT